jgi:hypothetical protein
MHPGNAMSRDLVDRAVSARVSMAKKTAIDPEQAVSTGGGWDGHEVRRRLMLAALQGAGGAAAHRRAGMPMAAFGPVQAGIIW